MFFERYATHTRTHAHAHAHAHTHTHRYAAAEGAAEAMNNVYRSLATYLSAEQHELALVDSSTTAFAKALYSTKLARGVRRFVALSLCCFVAPPFGLLSHFPGRTIQTIQYRPYNISQPQHIIAGQQLLLVSGIHCASDFERASARERESERARGRAFFASRSARHARHLNRRTLAYLWGFRV